MRLTFALLLMLLPAAAARAQTPVHVVATFSILGDMVKAVGGDRVEVTTLVGPGGDVHVYHATPADAQAIATADLVVANGLGLEGWIDRLMDASGSKATFVTVATHAVEDDDDHAAEARHDEHAAEAGHEDDHDEHAAEAGHDDHDEHAAEAGHDEHAAEVGHDEHDEHAAEAGHDGHDEHAHAIDPHAWQDLGNGVAYSAEIAEALSAIDPAGADAYAARQAAYANELRELEHDFTDRLADIPQDRRTVVTAHDAFGYFERAYGIEFVAPVGVSTEADVSARDLAEVIQYIRAHGVDAIFAEGMSNPRLVEQVAAETGVKIGGTLYADTLSDANGPAATYLAMMQHNMDALLNVLAPKSH